jgi:hypothetical protein
MGKNLIARLRRIDVELWLVCAWLALSIACMLVPLVASAQSAGGLRVPAAAWKYLPTLVDRQDAIWPDAPIPSFLGAQIEQETCLSLSHPNCWSPRAELRTPRENGIGFGQFTRAYRADGSIRFDKISELAREHKSLRGWNWNTRYDPAYQLTAIVEADRAIYGRTHGAASPRDQLEFTLSAYNGGEGGLLQDRRLCGNTDGCDSSRWTGNVEGTSLKSRAPSAGYGKPFFLINREYVSNIIGLRRQKYAPYFREQND